MEVILLRFLLLGDKVNGIKGLSKLYFVFFKKILVINWIGVMFVKGVLL